MRGFFLMRLPVHILLSSATFQAADTGLSRFALCKHSARDIPQQLRRPASEEESLFSFKHSPPSSEFLPCLTRSIDFILRLLGQEARYGLCLKLQLRERGTAFPTKIEVGSNSTHSRIGHLAI
jgi:hypothetical protein